MMHHNNLRSDGDFDRDSLEDQVCFRVASKIHPAKIESDSVLDEFPPPTLSSYISTTSRGKISSNSSVGSIDSQASVKTIKASNFGRPISRKRNPTRLPSLEDIPADRPLSANTPELHQMPDEQASRTFPKRGPRPFLHGSMALSRKTALRPPSTKFGAALPVLTPTTSLLTGGQEETSLPVVDEEQNSSPSKVKRHDGMHLDQTVTSDSDSECSPLRGGEDIDELMPEEQQRRRIILIGTIMAVICLVLGIILAVLAHPQNPSEQANPIPISISTFSPTATPVRFSAMAGVKPIDDIVSPFDGNRSPSFSQVGRDIATSHVDAVHLAKDGSVLAAGAHVYQFVHGEWQPLGQAITSLSIGSTSLSADGHSFAVALGEIVSVYGLDENKYWARRGDPIPTYSHSSAALVRLSADGNILSVATPKDGQVRVYEFESDRWKKIGTTIEDFEKQEQMAIDISGDGLTVAIATWTISNRRTRVYRRGPTNRWDIIGQELELDSFFQRGDSAGAKVSISLDSGANTLAVTSNEVTRVYGYIGGIWAQIGRNLIGGGSVSLSDEGTMAIGNHGNVFVYTLKKGRWVENNRVIPGAMGGATHTTVALSGNRFVLGRNDPNRSGGKVQVYQVIV